MSKQIAFNKATHIKSQYFNDSWKIRVWENIDGDGNTFWYWSLQKGKVEIELGSDNKWYAYLNTNPQFVSDSSKSPVEALTLVSSKARKHIRLLTIDLMELQ